MFARALRWRVSAYDEFLFVGALELDPCAASPAGFVSGIPLFTDNPFQTARFLFFEQPFGIISDRARMAKPFTRARAQVFQNVLSRLQPPVVQALAFKLK